jgi:hypothetical protein
VVARIWFLAKKGLTSMMVLFDFLSKRIIPLQLRVRLAWLYTGENDTTWLERGRGPNLDLMVLYSMLLKMSTDPFSGDFINPLVPCMPICLEQTVRSLLLKKMPTLDDIDITAQQTGDQFHGVHILGTDAVGSQRSADTTSGSGKGKEKISSSESASKVGSRSPSSDAEVSSEEVTPLQRKKRLVHSDGSTIGGTSLSGHQAPKKAAAPQPDPKAVASMVPGGSGGGGSTTTVKEAATAAVFAAAKKAVEAATTKEVTVAKKATKVVVVKKSAEEANAKVVAEVAAVKKVTEEAVAREAAGASVAKKATE